MNISLIALGLEIDEIIQKQSQNPKKDKDFQDGFICALKLVKLLIKTLDPLNSKE